MNDAPPTLHKTVRTKVFQRSRLRAGRRRFEAEQEAAAKAEAEAAAAAERVERVIDLSAAQNAFRKSTARYRGFCGGRGAGKSWVGAYDLLMRAIPGRTYLIASPTGVLLGDTTLPTFRQIAESVGLWSQGDTRLTPYPTAKLANGATVRFRTAEDPEKLRGPNLSGVWLDEASIMPEDAYRISIASLREAGENGWLSATFTPKGRYHWTYDVFGKSRPDTELIRSRTRENPFLAPDFAATIARQYPGQFASQELDGEFVDIEGSWWSANLFPETLWFRDWPQGLCGMVLALDPALGRESKTAATTANHTVLRREGDYSALVAVARDRDANYWVESEIVRRNDAENIAASIAFADRVRRESGCDVDGFGVESVGFQEVLANRMIEAVRKTGYNYNLHKIETGGVPKETRIRRLSEWIATGRLRFRDTPGTRLLVRQLQEFPVGKHDDGPDCLEQAKRLGELLWDGRRPGRR